MFNTGLLLGLLLLCIFFLFTHFSGNLRTEQKHASRQHALERRLEVTVALVLCGAVPTSVSRDRARLLNCARWPASVRVFSQASEEFGSYPLEALQRCNCELAVMVPWGVDLVTGWDEIAMNSVEMGKIHIHSHFVQSSRRMETWWPRFAVALPPPTITYEKHVRLLPDYRLMVSTPAIIADLMPLWFDSFWFGVVATVHKPVTVRALPRPIATDSTPTIDLESPVPLDEISKATLLSCLLSPFPVHPTNDLLLRCFLSRQQQPPTLELPPERRILECD